MKIKSFKYQRLSVLCALLLFAATACSSDETGQDNNNQSDVSTLTDSGGNSADLDASKLSDTDPGDTSTGKSDTTSTGKNDVDPGADVESNPDSGEPEPDPDSYPEVDPVECAFPSDDPECAPGEFGAGTFLTEFQIVEDKSCCYDFNGDGTFDNFLGSLVGMLNTLPGFGDINANIGAAINQGELVYLFEYSGLEHPKYDSDFQLTVYEGCDSDHDFSPNLLGAGDFEVLPHSYEVPGTPKWRFEKARVHNGELLATGGTLQISFPGMLDEITMILENVRIRAKVEQEGNMAPDLTAAGRVWLSQGELAGALKRDTLFESLNEAAKGCECIQDVEEIYTYNSTNDRFECEVTSADANRCRSASAECQSLTEQMTCKSLELQSNKVDVDTDNDDKPDAFSFGARFTGVGASIVGIAEDETP